MSKYSVRKSHINRYLRCIVLLATRHHEPATYDRAVLWCFIQKELLSICSSINLSLCILKWNDDLAWIRHRCKFTSTFSFLQRWLCHVHEIWTIVGLETTSLSKGESYRNLLVFVFTNHTEPDVPALR